MSSKLKSIFTFVALWTLLLHPIAISADTQTIPPPSITPSQYTICIDPGHPSDVGRGTAGKHITEIQAVWQVAVRLRKQLTGMGYHVVMTKHAENEFVKNQTRAEIANRNHADYMVRLHCDAYSGSGIASYSPNQQGVFKGFKGPSKEIIAESQSMGRIFHKEMVQSLNHKLIDRGFHPDIMTAVGRRQGALTGSIFSKVPVVLVEMCVLTNKHDEDFIIKPGNQELMAKAIANGITAALSTKSSR